MSCVRTQQRRMVAVPVLRNLKVTTIEQVVRTVS